MKKQTNRQFYSMKFHSSRLKKFKYDIEFDFYKGQKDGEIVSLADNQILRTIRRVVYNKPNAQKSRMFNKELLEIYYRDLKKAKNNKDLSTVEKKNLIKNITKKINDMMFIPEYVTVVMDNNSHYNHIQKHGFKINGKNYKRLSTSASQGRVSTVSFCSEDIIDEVNEILDNNRDKSVLLAPSKYNAYKGLYSSATHVVTEPRFCVIDDYSSEVQFRVNHVTTTTDDEDDLIIEKEITKSFDRFDGQGLISPTFAKVWANDLGLDYVPAEFCFRQSFMKGMLCVFDFHEFCEIANDGNYIIETIYKDENGNKKKVDLREIDVIITASQFKLWKSYRSLEHYIQSYRKNHLYWGVSLYTDKQLKDVLNYNYQFLQVLNIKDEDIDKLCELFVDWIRGVNYENIWYTLLFLLGTNATESGIKQFFKVKDNWWIKALAINHDLIHDKYIRKKIYDLIKIRITNGCVGRILLEGNNQTLVSDPYAFMQYATGQKVTGLLGKNEYYSNYWNERGVNKVVGTRPPLTYRSEVTRLNLVENDRLNHWYRHLYGGIIVNVHGWETDLWAGSDWDFDFLSTTSNEVVYNSVYDGELVVVYDAPKPQPLEFNDDVLAEFDKFSFGSKIGAITNKSTSAIALLPVIEENFGKDSEHYKVLLNRIRMCTKLQNSEIDKSKIGRKMKGIPKIWVDRKYIDSLDVSDDKKELYKDLMLDRHPYFFVHLYNDTKSAYKKHWNKYDLSSKNILGLSLQELLNKDDRTNREQEIVNLYNKYNPVIESSSVMNRICRYIESVDFGIKGKLKSLGDKDTHLLLMRNNTPFDKIKYKKIVKIYKDFKKNVMSNNTFTLDKTKFNADFERKRETIVQEFQNQFDHVCSDQYELVDYLIMVHYVDVPTDNKTLLWDAYGDVILDNLKRKLEGNVMFPFPDVDGDIEYLSKRYKLKGVNIE